MSNLTQKQYVREEQRQVQTVQNRIEKRLTRGEKYLMALIVMAVVVTAVLMVSNYASMYGQQQEISQLQSEINQQQQYNEGLEHQVSELSDPERILEIAQDNGMELNENNVTVLQP
ncbi:cell division protein FtsL [Salicibibacter halophilus]|uniref:Cell division protein FtsL n=1 Tax=Salicibibacter halophilus TaxID=2502791 RepID=A0A514LFG8_9BACI|nr:cell division protein FtsL [Salicibibacter halophilus]QDI90607.1 cell division protein FtsL [Salicibibacter halophilus]